MVPCIPELVNSDFNTLRVARMHEVEMQAVIAPLYSEDCPQVSSERTAGEKTYCSLTRECPGCSRRAVSSCCSQLCAASTQKALQAVPCLVTPCTFIPVKLHCLYSSPNGHRPVFQHADYELRSACANAVITVEECKPTVLVRDPIPCSEATIPGYTESGESIAEAL